MGLGDAKFEFVTVQRNSSVFTAMQDLSDMFHMLLFILVKDNYVIHYLPDALYPNKGLVHSPVVVLTNGRYPVWCCQIFESAKLGDESCQVLALFI